MASVFLLPQLSSAEDLVSEKQSSEIFQESVEIEGIALKRFSIEK